METAPFVDSFRELHQRVVTLLESMSALTELSALGTRIEGESALVDSVLAILLENEDIERCSLLLLDRDMLRNAGGKDWHDLIHRGKWHGSEGVLAEFQLGEGVAGQAALEGRLQHCRDCSVDPRFVPKPDSPSRHLSGALICVPLLAGDRVLGVLCVYHPEPGHFNEGHERFLNLYAAFVAQILSGSRYTQRLEEDIQRRTRDLERALLKTEELKDRFRQLSIVDELTELHNRRFFFPEAEAALSRAIRYRHPFSVLLLDLDHFKAVNDHYGHATGDRVLREVAALLCQQIRSGDVLARFGGEEFVLALPNTDREGALLLAERILNRVRTHRWEVDVRKCPVSISIGLGSLAGDSAETADASLDRLLQQADQALYRSKSRGRDCVTVYGDAAPNAPSGN